jgi:hypothetical protein
MQMIDWENERVIPIKDVTKYVKSRCSGKRVSPATVWRWAKKRNNPLETFVQGGGRFTSIEAIGRFIERCSNNTSTDPIQSSARARKAGQELRKLVGGGSG